MYIVVNEAWPGYCKLGFALNLKNRLRQMNTNDPFRKYKYHATRMFKDRKAAEAALHELAAGYRKTRTEWFQLHPDDAKRILTTVSI